VYVEHSVWDNLVLSLKGPRGVFASLFRRITSTERDRLDELLKLIRLDAKRDWKAGLLAHGEKQWLEIGMLLAQEPKVLLVDEPAAGMTDEETHRTGELLISLSGKHSIVVVEHDMTFVKQIARQNNVTVLHQGTVLCEGKFDEVQADPKVREVYLGRGKHGTR
jgi:urea transport system ATP-binding protein